MSSTHHNADHGSVNGEDRTDIENIQKLLGPRYQLNRIVGRGGMSTVWLAHDTQEHRDVAVKVLKPEYTEHQEFRIRFRQEAEAAETLHSPNVVSTYDYGENPNGRTPFCYIVMEYVQGESLADILAREHQLPEPLALDIIRQTAQGLATIHQAQMVHRDIKPGNLLITPEGQVKITDFGIAKAASAVPLTQTGMVVGTAQYVSPEQAQGKNVEPSSDIYSLGVLAYELLSGDRPFSGDSTVSVALKHINETPLALPRTVSAPLRELVGICLRKDPQRRFVDGAELAAATAFVLEGKRPPQPRSMPPQAIPQSSTAHPVTEQLGAITSVQRMGPPKLQGPVPAQWNHSSAPLTSADAVGIATSAVSSNSDSSSKKKKAGLLWLLILAAIVALLGAIGVLAMNNSSDSNSDSSNPDSSASPKTSATTSSSASATTSAKSEHVESDTDVDSGHAGGNNQNQGSYPLGSDNSGYGAGSPVDTTVEDEEAVGNSTADTARHRNSPNQQRTTSAAPTTVAHTTAPSGGYSNSGTAGTATDYEEEVIDEYYDTPSRGSAGNAGEYTAVTTYYQTSYQTIPNTVPQGQADGAVVTITEYN